MGHHNAPGTSTHTQPFDGPAVERLILRLPERYAAVRLLGGGGQGMVWLADDRELGEQVAIKVLARLDEVAAERVRREVRLCRRLRHANLAEIYELIEAGDHLAVVMEHLPGGSLKDRLNDGSLPIDEVVRIARSLLAGLAHLHDHGIVHRDVKPANVLYAADGTPKLADFGLLRSLADNDGLTKTGFSVGTPAYMSPEQVRGEEPLPASDLYSLGVTLFGLLTGGPPFAAATGFEVAHQHLTRRPPPVRHLRRDCPRWLAAFVERLLEKEARRRWRDAGAALAAFERHRPGLSRRTRRGLAGAAAVAAIGAACALGLHYAQARAGLAVRVEGTTLVATSASGHELWRKLLEVVQVSATVADVLPPRGPEVVTAEVTSSGDIPSSAIVVRGRDGRELRHESLTHLETTRYFREFSDSFRAGALVVRDLDGDGFDDVVVPLLHDPFFPSMVCAWRPAHDATPQGIFSNSGHIQALSVADLDGDGSPEVVMVGVNNILGYQHAVAILSIAPDGRGPLPFAASPELMNAGMGNDPGEPMLRSYTLLGEARGGIAIVATGRDGVTIRLGDHSLRLDVNGNPEGSPVFAQGPQARQEFWSDRISAGTAILQQPEAADHLVTAFAARNSAVWAEQPSRDAALMLFARDLGDAGRPGLGAALLARADHGDATIRRVWRQRGELLFLTGDRDGGQSWLNRSVRSSVRGADFRDELAMLVLDSLVNGDVDAAERYRSQWLNGANLSGWEQWRWFAILQSFLAGDWAGAQRAAPDQDPVVWPWQAYVQWAGLESGAPPQKILDELKAIGARPEARDLCLIVEARAHTRSGDERTAIATANQALDHLRGPARRSYEQFLWEGMAHWVLGAALADSGDLAAARPHLEITSSRLPGTWLGRDARARLRKVGLHARP